jgi:antitoxin ParD1/3/4
MNISYFEKNPTGIAMPPVQKRTISLPAAQARFIDSKVRAGTYASASEVVRAGLRALEERDAAVESWLRSEVGPAYDTMKADPSAPSPRRRLLPPFVPAMQRSSRHRNVAVRASPA